MSDSKPVVLRPVEARIADCERAIAQMELAREVAAFQLAGLEVLIYKEQTRLVQLRQEKNKEVGLDGSG